MGFAHECIGSWHCLMSLQSHSPFFFFCLKGHSNLGRFLRTRKDQCHSYLQEGQEQRYRKQKTDQPHLSPWEINGASYPGKQFQTHGRQKDGEEYSAWICGGEIRPELSDMADHFVGDSWAMKQVAQRGWGVFLLGDIQKSSGNGPGQHAVGSPVWAGGLILMISKGLFQIQPFFDSVIMTL